MAPSHDRNPKRSLTKDTKPTIIQPPPEMTSHHRRGSSHTTNKSLLDLARYARQEALDQQRQKTPQQQAREETITQRRNEWQQSQQRACKTQPTDPILQKGLRHPRTPLETLDPSTARRQESIWATHAQLRRDSKATAPPIGPARPMLEDDEISYIDLEDGVVPCKGYGTLNFAAAEDEHPFPSFPTARERVQEMRMARWQVWALNFCCAGMVAVLVVCVVGIVVGGLVGIGRWK